MNTALHAEYLFNRLSKRYRHLKKWARRTGTNAFRLYDRDIPEIPLVLDFYGDAVSGAFYHLNDADICSDEHSPVELYSVESWLPAMKASIAEALNIQADNIFIKERRRMRRKQDTGVQYSKVAGKGFYRDVREGDLCFRVNLSDYLDTGLFLDSRGKRALIRSCAAGKRVLNLFAYTCSLSVAAAKGGARQVDSVDLSNTYLEWGRINFALNGLEGRHSEGALALIREDVPRFLGRAAREKLSWDIIILDPPSFSNSKKMSNSLDIRRDHAGLIRNCLSLLSPGGMLMFSSNRKGFSLEGADYPLYTVKDMRKELVDEDFKGKRMPACYTLSQSPNYRTMRPDVLPFMSASTSAFVE
jgi:23S rRNA G2069 N7-methylase RlmK/C1962 C5-methylase RlmI